MPICFSCDVAGTGVTANSLHPGGVATNIWNTLEQVYAAPVAKIIRYFVRYICGLENSRQLDPFAF